MRSNASGDPTIYISSLSVDEGLSDELQRHEDEHDIQARNETNSIDVTPFASTTTMTRNRSLFQYRCRMILLIVLPITIFLIFVDARTTKYLETFSTSFIDWLSIHPISGIFVVILVYIGATILFIPGSILTIGVGYAFQRALHHNTGMAVLCASVAVFVGACLGSIACFLLGRYLFRESVMRLANQYPIFCAIDRALEGNGFKIMLLLRLSPLIPYNALDYISGITSISIRQYSLALLGILPGTISFCYIGATASTFTDGTTSAKNNNAIHTIILILGIVFALAGGLVASYYSKIELDKILYENRNHPDFIPLDTSDVGNTTVGDESQATILSEDGPPPHNTTSLT